MKGFTTFPAPASDPAGVFTTHALPLAFSGTGNSNLIAAHPLCLPVMPARLPEFRISTTSANPVCLAREEKLKVADEPYTEVSNFVALLAVAEPGRPAVLCPNIWMEVRGRLVLEGRVPWVSIPNPIMTIAGIPHPGFPEA